MNDGVLDNISKDIWQKALGKVSMDKDIGIKCAKIQNDRGYDVYVAKIENEEKIHYHKPGKKYYKIISGKGMLYMGRIDKDKVTEDMCKTVIEGDSFVIEPEWVHQLVNHGDDNLIILFSENKLP